jgi:hypothetical protein
MQSLHHTPSDGSAQQEGKYAFIDSIDEVQQAISSGAVTATALCIAYINR